MNPSEQLQQLSYKNWLSDGHGNNEILYEWQDINGTVVDLGGYEGVWSDKILKRNPNISKLVIYEPVREYYDRLVQKYKDNKKVMIFPYAASNNNNSCLINVAEAGSSVNIRKSGYTQQQEIRKIDFGSHIYNYQLDGCVDLLKINIEGDEFDVIDSLNVIGNLKNINHILLQPHPYGEDPIKDYETLYDILTKTHDRIWNYHWIWEYWRLR